MLERRELHVNEMTKIESGRNEIARNMHGLNCKGIVETGTKIGQGGHLARICVLTVLG